MHSHHHNHHDTHHDHHDPRLDHCAPDCDDQIPIMASMSRGLTGNSFRIDVHDDTDGLTEQQLKEMFADPESAKWFDFCDETFLEGLEYDEATKTWSSKFMSENINGGRLHYQYNLRPHTIPQTFTITFILRRPGRTEWSWTTPAIPYIAVVDGDGQPIVDGHVGSGIANLFVRESLSAPWVQTERHGDKTDVPPPLTDNTGRWGQINWPHGTGPKDYNGVAPDEAWAAGITFGYGGDVPLPNLDDIAKIIGVTREIIERILQDVPGAIDGSDNVKDYIDDNVEHIHKDMGFGTSLIGDTPSSVIPAVTLPLPKPNAGQPYTIKNYIDYRTGRLQQAIDDLNAGMTKINNTLNDIVNKVYGGGTINQDGSITWPNTQKIATGDLNIFANNTNPTNATTVDALRSRALSDDDVMVN